jgi:hypothetical protein
MTGAGPQEGPPPSFAKRRSAKTEPLVRLLIREGQPSPAALTAWSRLWRRLSAAVNAAEKETPAKGGGNNLHSEQ